MSKGNAILLMIILAIALVAIVSTIVVARFTPDNSTREAGAVGWCAAEIGQIRKDKQVLDADALRSLPGRLRSEPAFQVLSDRLTAPELSFGVIVALDDFESGDVICIGREATQGYLITAQGDVSRIDRADANRAVKDVFVFQAWLVE